MSFIVTVERIIPRPRAACFRDLSDFTTWKDWTPASFRPVRGPDRELRLGDRLVARLDVGFHVPTSLRIDRLEQDRAIMWTGGVKGLLRAEHHFELYDEGEGTRVVSRETWSGAITSVGPLARVVRKLAEKIGQEQVGALDHA